MFKEWFNLQENLKIIHVDPEEDWDIGEKAYEIARKVNIRPNSTKSPTIIAINDNDDEVIGAAFTSWSHDEDATQHTGEPYGLWDFDIVVDPKWQGYQMVGMKLIKAAENMRKEMEEIHGATGTTRLWVVNPKLAKVLQHPKYGYNAESEYEDGSAHLVKY